MPAWVFFFILRVIEPNPILSTFTPTFFSLSGLSTFAAVLIYTFQRKEILQDPRELSKGHFGYCFILAWVCIPLLLSSGVLYVHLRKKTHTAA